MLKKLKIKFLLITYISIFIVVSLIIGIINMYNYSSTIEKHEKVINHFLNDELDNSSIPIVLKYVVRIDINTSTILQGYLSEGYDVKQIVNDIVNKNQLRGKYYNFMYGIDDNILILSNMERENQVSTDFMINSITISLIGILGVYLIIYLLSSYILKPFIKNEENQKEFITNVSHELKTPITIIKANIDVLKIDNIQNEWTSSIENQVDRLELLTYNLIELCKLEELNDSIIKTEFSLTDAIYEVYSEYEQMFSDKKISFNIESTNNITYNGNEKQIRDVIKLILDNMLKYTFNNEASITLDNKEILFTNSTELSPGNYDHIFNRFVRIDEARNLSGYGIGLSIVKKILENHNCDITANVINKQFILKIKLEK